MKEERTIAYKDLIEKINQHEKVIAQLVEIIAATNRQVTDIISKQKEREK